MFSVEDNKFGPFIAVDGEQTIYKKLNHFIPRDPQDYSPSSSFVDCDSDGGDVCWNIHYGITRDGFLTNMNLCCSFISKIEQEHPTYDLEVESFNVFTLNAQKPTKAEFNKVTNYHRSYSGPSGGSRKPWGGLWSTPVPVGWGSWHHWCIDEMPEWASEKHIWQLEITGRVFTLDDQSDYDRLMRLFGRRSLSMPYPEVDWEALFRYYDIFYLTEDGLMRFRSSSKRFDFYTWDVPTILIGHWRCVKHRMHIASTLKKLLRRW